MRVPTGAFGLVAIIVGVGLLGAGLEATVGDVERVDEISIADEGFTSQTRLCPPGTASDGALWVATQAEDARVGFEPIEDETTALPAETLLRRDAIESAVDVVGYDSPVAAAATYEFGADSVGAGSTACSSTASDHWYFAQGSTENEFNQRIMLYNPFPEEASVRMTLYRERGTKSPSLLSDISVPANDFTIVDFVERTNPTFGRVSTEIIASRGRVVAWRSMIVRAEGHAEGAEFSLGTTRTSPIWYFPDGARDEETFTSLYLMNTTEDEASVRVSLTTDKRLLQPPGLEEIVIPPMTSRPLGLQRALNRQDIPGSFGMIVESTTPIVAERTIGSNGASPGRSAEVGAPAASPRWSLPPAALGGEDDRLIVMNPGTERVDVQVILSRTEGPALEPERLQVSIPAGGRRNLSLTQWREQAPFAASVTASGPVVAERAAQFSGDRSSAMGTPLSD